MKKQYKAGQRLILAAIAMVSLTSCRGGEQKRESAPKVEPARQGESLPRAEVENNGKAGEDWHSEQLLELLNDIPDVQVQPEMTESGAAIVIGSRSFADDPRAKDDLLQAVKDVTSARDRNCRCCECPDMEATSTPDSVRIQLLPPTQEELYEEARVTAVALQAALNAR
jgi:hypothetical protein